MKHFGVACLKGDFVRLRTILPGGSDTQDFVGKGQEISQEWQVGFRQQPDLVPQWPERKGRPSIGCPTPREATLFDHRLLCSLQRLPHIPMRCRYKKEVSVSFAWMTIG